MDMTENFAKFVISAMKKGKPVWDNRIVYAVKLDGVYTDQQLLAISWWIINKTGEAFP